jgi:hypothetical protein
MAQMVMESSEGRLDNSKGTLESTRWQRVEAIAALPFKQDILRVAVLYQEKPRVKLHENIIIQSKTMHGNEILCGGGNVKNFV